MSFLDYCEGLFEKRDCLAILVLLCKNSVHHDNIQRRQFTCMHLPVCCKDELDCLVQHPQRGVSGQALFCKPAQLFAIYFLLWQIPLLRHTSCQDRCTHCQLPDVPPRTLSKRHEAPQDIIFQLERTSPAKNTDVKLGHCGERDNTLVYLCVEHLG